MPKVSSNSLRTILERAVTGSKAPSYTPQKLKTFLNKTKISHPNFGSQRLNEVMKKPALEQKKVFEIFKKAKEEGILKEKTWTKSKEEFFRQAAKQERIDKQAEQKNPATKQENIAQARRISGVEERRRSLMFGSGAIREQERVRQSGEQFRKEEQTRAGVQDQEKKYELRFRGKAAQKGGSAEGKTNQFLNRVMQEEKGGKSEQAAQKNSGRQGPELKGTAGIDQLTHPEQAAAKDFSSGIIQVDDLSGPPIQESESKPSQKPAPSADELADLDIG